MTFLLRIPIYRRSYKSVGAGEYILRLRGARRPALYASFAGAGARAPDSSSRQGWSAGSGSPGGRAPAERFARLVPRRLAVAAGSVRSLGQICPSCAPAWPRRSAVARPWLSGAFIRPGCHPRGADGCAGRSSGRGVGEPLHRTVARVSCFRRGCPRLVPLSVGPSVVESRYVARGAAAFACGTPRNRLRGGASDSPGTVSPNQSPTDTDIWSKVLIEPVPPGKGALIA